MYELHFLTLSNESLIVDTSEQLAVKTFHHKLPAEIWPYKLILGKFVSFNWRS